MKTNNIISTMFILIFTALVIVGCKDKSTEPELIETDDSALKELALEDSTTGSFEINYQENGDISFLGKTEVLIYPIKVKRIVNSVTRTSSSTIVGDTAYVTVNHSFIGELWIYASRDSARWGDTTQIDTTIKKPFTTTITRKMIFTRIGRSNRPKQNWKLQAVSLPEGGTAIQNNIDIRKLTVTSLVDTFTVTDPNNYYLRRGIGWWRQIPIIPKNTNVSLRIEVYSSVSDTDFVTLTFGGIWPSGLHRAKKRFVLISSTPTTGGYLKVYEQTFTAHQYVGHYHAIIDAMPKGVIYDDAKPVETNAWGFPYYIKY
jgi:hypothetical protein